MLQRDLEREIIPMAKVEGMAIAPWNVLAAGKVRTDAEEEERRQTGEKGMHADMVLLRSVLTSASGRTMMDPRWERNETEKKIAKALEEVAAEVGASNIQAGSSPTPPSRASASTFSLGVH